MSCVAPACRCAVASYTRRRFENAVVELADSAQKVPATWSRVSSTKSCARYRTPKIVSLLAEHQQNTERLTAEADRAYLEFLDLVSAEFQELRHLVSRLATADCLISLAAVALLPGYVRPTMIDEARFDVQGARHPVIEQIRDDPCVALMQVLS